MLQKKNCCAQRATRNAADAGSVMGYLSLWLLAGTLLLLNGCGGPVPTQLAAAKTVVIGSPAEITQKRQATKSGKKNKQNTSVLHTRSIGGVAIPDDAPHPFIMSSGQILVSTKRVGEVQVAFHENLQGKVSNVIPATFQSSDASIVSTVRTDPSHPNAVLLTLTGKKGNSFITSYEQNGNAISKFMVLAAEPRDDVLVVTDPDIHPTLCMIVPDRQVYEYCDFSSSTDFDQGNTGDRFNIDNYLNLNPQTKPAILFDEVGYSKIDSPDLDFKSAIYFESIDTLFILSRNGIKRTRTPIYNGGRQISGDKSALLIERVATQKEFNDYINYGGLLTSSLLHDPNQTDMVANDIQLGNPAKGVLSAVVLQDGTRLSVTEATLLGAVNGNPSKISQHIYTMVQVGQLASESLFTCTIKASDGGVPSIAFTSFHSEASTKLSGKFLWNGGKPDIELDLNPFANMGGQVVIVSKAGASVNCHIELIKIPLSEYVLPLFGRVEIDVPISAAADFGVQAAGTVVLVTPKFHISGSDDVTQPGKVGVSYTPAGGFKTDFNMKTTLSTNRLGLAQGTTVPQNTGGGPKIGMDLSAGIELGIELSAKVKTWLFKAEVNADLANVLLGFKAGGAYTIDYTKQTSKKVSSDGEAGIGAFFTVAPTLSVHTSFFTLSYNLFSFDAPPIWIYKFPFVESTEPDEPLAPAEKNLTLAFVTCSIGRPGNPAGTFVQYCYQVPSDVVGPVNVKGISSSEAIGFERPSWYGIPKTGFKYYYTYIDKPTGQLRKLKLPATVGPDGTFTVQKPGITNIYYEYIMSDQHVVTEFYVDGSLTFGQGCNYWLNSLGGSPVNLDAYDCAP